MEHRIQWYFFEIRQNSSEICGRGIVSIFLILIKNYVEILENQMILGTGKWKSISMGILWCVEL